jgi:hypothetical protein
MADIGGWGIGRAGSGGWGLGVDYLHGEKYHNASQQNLQERESGNKFYFCFHLE